MGDADAVFEVCMSAPQSIPMTPEMVEALKKSAAANAAVRLAIEARAKAAYDVFAYRVGEGLAWERVSGQFRATWIEMVEFIEADPECQDCGSPLQCVYCDADAVASTIADALKGTE